MPRLIPVISTSRIYLPHDTDRSAGVVRSTDENGGLIRFNEVDLPFSWSDVLGSTDKFHQGRTVTFLMVDDRATLVCNIHDDESIKALIALRSAVHA